MPIFTKRNCVSNSGAVSTTYAKAHPSTISSPVPANPRRKTRFLLHATNLPASLNSRLLTLPNLVQDRVRQIFSRVLLQGATAQFQPRFRNNRSGNCFWNSLLVMHGEARIFLFFCMFAAEKDFLYKERSAKHTHRNVDCSRVCPGMQF